jgi:hypothetical protein
MYVAVLLTILACPPPERVPERVRGGGAETGAAAEPTDQALAEAQAQLAGAREAEARAVAEETNATAGRDATRADISAAEQEIQAASAHRDQPRVDAARALLARREAEEAEAEALVRWKTRARAAADADVAAAQAQVDVRTAERELRRLDEAGRRGEGGGYTRSAFFQQLADNQLRWENARKAAKEAHADAEDARQDWIKARVPEDGSPASR